MRPFLLDFLRGQTKVGTPRAVLDREAVLPGGGLGIMSSQEAGQVWQKTIHGKGKSKRRSLGPTGRGPPKLNTYLSEG